VILIHQRNRETDGQTDGPHAISIPRYALVHRAVKTERIENGQKWEEKESERMGREGK